MALTATRTSNGFEPIGHLFFASPNPRKWELTPNTAFSKGDAVILTSGKVAVAAAGATNVLGVMAEAYTTTTNPSAARTLGWVYDDPFTIYQCTFSDHIDGTATSGSTTTLADTVNIGSSADSRWVGALLYIYDGAAKGTLRTVTAYTNATRLLTWVGAAYEAVDTTSKFIVLGAAAAAGDVINAGKIGVDLKDENTIDGNATVDAEAGPLVVMNPGDNLADYIKELMLPVMFRKHLYRTP